jgi:3-keto-disaccharide hydrolase
MTRFQTVPKLPAWPGPVARCTTPQRKTIHAILLLAIGLVLVEHPTGACDEPKDKKAEWTSLFDGKSLGKWRSTQFGGEADVSVEDGMIVLPIGEDMTGITWRGDPPARMNYEIELEAKRVDGNDFFCGLTFPVGKDFCSLICGGWGGGVTGLSSLDGNDASRNETSQWINYEKGRWYRIRVKVTEHRIEAWLDNKQIVDTDTTDRKLSIRGEVDPSKPLGIATWRTTGAIRNIRLRKLNETNAKQ